jgi:hypothetical protein
MEIFRTSVADAGAVGETSANSHAANRPMRKIGERDAACAAFGACIIHIRAVSIKAICEDFGPMIRAQFTQWKLGSPVAYHDCRNAGEHKAAPRGAQCRCAAIAGPNHCEQRAIPLLKRPARDAP